MCITPRVCAPSLEWEGEGLRGKFDWAASGRFPGFTEPSESYHGLKFSETFGPVAFAIKARVETLRDLGPALNPFAAFRLLQGVETLMVGEAPQGRLDVVFGTREPQFASEGASAPEEGGVWRCFELWSKGWCVGCQPDGRQLEVGESPGQWDAKTLVIHPATTTHQQLTSEEQLASGVTPDLIRVSVGIEAMGDIIADFEAALKVVPGQ
ncbi:hypothetical protein HWV62_1743 [Athelia sp. TMB]|nr:hypothetical protein HWV62_1743 [Athelia sp. TMB]